MRVSGFVPSLGFRFVPGFHRSDDFLRNLQRFIDPTMYWHAHQVGGGISRKISCRRGHGGYDQPQRQPAGLSPHPGGGGRGATRRARSARSTQVERALVRTLFSGDAKFRNPSTPRRGARTICDPCRGRDCSSSTGGIASLNPRLIAGNPLGCKTGSMSVNVQTRYSSLRGGTRRIHYCRP